MPQLGQLLVTRPLSSCPDGSCLPRLPACPAAACPRALHQDAAQDTDSEVVGATMRMRAGQAADDDGEAGEAFL